MAKPVLNQFNGGEISPWLEGRTDLAKYASSARLMKNFIPQVEGSVIRRGGSHFVASVKEVDAVLFSISATPTEANVYINNELCDKIYVAPFEKVTYHVEMEGYQSVSGVMVVEEDTELKIDLLSQLYRAKLTILSNPAEADVYINSVFGNVAEVVRGSSASYKVEKQDYACAEGQVQVMQDMTLTVNLKMKFEILPTPADAKVTINGIVRNSVEVDAGSLVEYRVEKSGYQTVEDSLTITKSQILEVNLTGGTYALNQVVFEKNTPGTYYLNILTDGYYNLSAAGGGGGGGGSAGAHAWYGGNGGSGAAFMGKVWLEKGKYTIAIGAGGEGGKASGKNATRGQWAYSAYDKVKVSTFLTFNGKATAEPLLDCFGGEGGHGTGAYAAGGGSGGAIKVYDALKVVSKTVCSNGEKESSKSLLSNGSGCGGKAGDLGQNGASGTNGYVKIVYLGQV